MDTKKLLFEIDNESFFGHYTETLRKLYDDAFIARNHLMHSTLESFSRSMALQAGKKGDVTIFTEEDLIKIAQETNTKYEEYATGGYTAAFRKQGEDRYRNKSKILYETFMSIGCEKAAKTLKYVADEKEEEQTEDIFEESSTATENTSIKFEEMSEIKRYEDILEAAIRDLKANGTKKFTIIKNSVEEARKLAGESDDDTHRIKELLDEIDAILDHPEKDKQTLPKEDQEEKLKASLMVEDLMTQINQPEEEDECEIPEGIFTALENLGKEIAIGFKQREIENIILEKDISDATKTISELKANLEAMGQKKPATDAERIDLIMSVISEVEDTKALKPVMIALMTKVL